MAFAVSPPFRLSLGLAARGADRDGADTMRSCPQTRERGVVRHGTSSRGTAFLGRPLQHATLAQLPRGGVKAVTAKGSAQLVMQRQRPRNKTNRMPDKGWDEFNWERPDFGFGDQEDVKRKLPSIPRSKMREWCKRHGLSFRTHVTMRPQRHFPKPWFCTTYVRSKIQSWKTIGDHTSKLGSVDESINKMYRHLLKDKRFKRWDDPLF
ncbi:hypothetical protein FVE85_3308 [Porphyridium purpureum]|uniref:Uncharacterized protein n=1 Tax=Porphyridium purpureum TaxID=35688 RepID=A0A5J4YX77_PORPP|nr:hypothetical protein FVE85_3308 [Porphyridium purpureum]|eukprot:POR8880..scf227_4